MTSNSRASFCFFFFFLSIHLFSAAIFIKILSNYIFKRQAYLDYSNIVKEWILRGCSLKRLPMKNTVNFTLIGKAIKVT